MRSILKRCSTATPRLEIVQILPLLRIGCSTGAQFCSVKNPVVLIDEFERRRSRFIFRINGDLAEVEVFREKKVKSTRRAVGDSVQWSTKRACGDVLHAAAFGNVRDRGVMHVGA